MEPEYQSIEKPIAVHIRRGDFKSHGRLLPLSYYEEALQKVGGGTPVIFSDDVDWSRRQSIFRGAYFVEGNPDWADLALMTMCAQHICANSTFSWWGAYLSKNASPIVPWLEGALPEHFRLVPDGWREIEVSSSI